MKTNDCGSSEPLNLIYEENTNNDLDKLKRVKDINDKIFSFSCEEETIKQQIEEHKSYGPPKTYDEMKNEYISNEKYSVEDWETKLKIEENSLKEIEEINIIGLRCNFFVLIFRLIIDFYICAAIYFKVFLFLLIPLGIRLLIIYKKLKNKHKRINYAEECIEKAKKELIKSKEELKNKEASFDSFYDEYYKRENNKYLESVDAIEKLEKELDKVHSRNETEINILNGQREGLINKAYFDDVDDLIDLIEIGRADTIKEAINVLEADKKADELIRLQRQYNQDERAHQQRIENEIEQQQKKAKLDAQRAAFMAEEQGKEQCFHCAYRYDCKLYVKVITWVIMLPIGQSKLGRLTIKSQV